MTQNVCSNCKLLRKYLNYFNKTKISVQMKNIKCRSSSAVAATDEEEEDLIVENCSDDEWMDGNFAIIKIEPKQNQIIFEGDPITLKCRIEGTTASATTIKWFLNNTQIINNSKTIKINHQNSTHSELTIDNLISRKHTGTWRCVADDRLKSTEIFIQVLRTKTTDDDDVKSCLPIETRTSRGVYRWNSTFFDQIIEQKCLFGAGVASYECSLSVNGANAYWYNLNVSQCDFESNLTRYLNSLLLSNATTDTRNYFNLTSKSSLLDYQLVIRLIEGNWRQNGGFLLDLYNFMSNETDFEETSVDFNRHEFKLSVNSLYRMLNSFAKSLNSTLESSYVSVVPSTRIVYKHSPLLAFYLEQFNISSSIISNHRVGGDRTILDFEIIEEPRTHELTVKRIKFVNYNHRYDDLLQSYTLLASNDLANWQQQFNQCDLVSFNEANQSVRVECNETTNGTAEWINFALRQENANKMTLYYFNESFIYFSSIVSSLLLLTNIVAYLVNSKRILMPPKFKHCLVNIWTNQLVQIVLNLVFLIQTQFKHVCLLNASLEHGLILSTCFWYLVFVYVFYRKLNKLLKTSEEVKTKEKETKKRKSRQFLYLYAISLGPPVFATLLAYSMSTNFDFIRNYCFQTQTLVLVLTLAFPILIIVIVIIGVSFKIMRVYKKILKSFEEEDGEGEKCSMSDDDDDDESVMDTQYRPRIQLLFILILFINYLLIQFLLILIVIQSGSSSSSLFVYIYSILLLVYSISNFCFYFLTRRDTFPRKCRCCRKNRNYYFEQNDVKIEEEDLSPAVSDFDEVKSIESAEGVVEANLSLLNELKSESPSIHYIDEAAATAATTSNYSFNNDGVQRQRGIRGHHLRNGSILSGQFNPEQQILINSLIDTTKQPSTPQTTLSKRAAPIYVFVDHKYEEKVVKKVVKSPDMSRNEEQVGGCNVWLNKFYESDQQPFKHETSV